MEITVTIVFSIAGPPDSRFIYRKVMLPAVPRVGDSIDAGILEDRAPEVVSVSWTLDGDVTVGLGTITPPAEASRADFLGMLDQHGWQGASPDP